MDVKVRFYDGYAEVAVSEGNATLVTGLLNKDEALALAKSFRETAKEIDSHFSES